jgi:hypothetical protein
MPSREFQAAAFHFARRIIRPALILKTKIGRDPRRTDILFALSAEAEAAGNYPQALGAIDDILGFVAWREQTRLQTIVEERDKNPNTAITDDKNKDTLATRSQRSLAIQFAKIMRVLCENDHTTLNTFWRVRLHKLSEQASLRGSDLQALDALKGVPTPHAKSRRRKLQAALAARYPILQVPADASTARKPPQIKPFWTNYLFRIYG